MLGQEFKALILTIALKTARAIDQKREDVHGDIIRRKGETD